MKIQACISGFAGKPSTVYALMDDDTGIVVISKEVPLKVERFRDSTIISNFDVAERDSLFTTDDFREGISAFFELINSSRLDIASAAARCSPNSQIERDGIDESGRQVYRVNSEVTNAQVATLAIAWYVKKAKGIEKMLDMHEQINALNDELYDPFSIISI